MTDLRPLKTRRRWLVNRDIESKELETIRLALKRDRPLGQGRWVEQMARKLGLGSG